MSEDDLRLGAADDDQRSQAGRDDVERYGLMAAVTLLIVLFLLVEDRQAPTVPPDVVDSSSVVVLELGGRTPPPARRRTPRYEHEERRANPGPRRPEPAPEPEPPPGPRRVVVAPGEALSVIVSRELGTVRRVAEVVRLNGLRSPDAIQAGQTLLLPPR